MACILQPECNFLHGFFRWHLPVEMVDMEVRITSMQVTHTFRRERICQVIKCNPWSTRLSPHPTITKKMKTYLELEGKLGPKPQSQSNQFRPSQPNTNTHVRKDSKVTKKRKEINSHNEIQSKGSGQARSQQCNHITTPNKPWGPSEFLKVRSSHQKVCQETTPNH